MTNQPTKVIDARSLPGHLQTKLRREAMKLIDGGATHAQAACQVGVSRTTVTRWATMRREQGEQSLAARRRGRKPGTGFLKAHQCAMIVKLMTNSHPEQLKLPFVLWTAPSVRLLIWEYFGIRLADRTVRAYLARWGFTPRRPIRNAVGQRPEDVQRWKEQESPRVRREARQAGAALMWLDETGIRSEEVAGRSYAPRGRTPCVAVTPGRLRLNVITVISSGARWLSVAFASISPPLSSSAFSAGSSVMPKTARFT